MLNTLKIGGGYM